MKWTVGMIAALMWCVSPTWAKHGATASLAVIEEAAADFIADVEFGDASPSNGHWICSCRCVDALTSDFLGNADIDGKCASDTEGSACRVAYDDEGGYNYGNLTECSNIFEID